VETNQQQHYQFDDEQLGQVPAPAENIHDQHIYDQNRFDNENFAESMAMPAAEVAPGIPIVRGSTPRPLTMEPLLSVDEQVLHMQADETQDLPGFPAKAPSAPPLPEELGDQEEGRTINAITPIPQPGQAKAATGDEQGFIWLFEYGLEMDSAVLNSPDRLDGLALLYGPAMLKGYSILFGKVDELDEHNGSKQTIATIVPGPDPAAEVWGVLYRIPQRLTQQVGNKPPILSIAHTAVAPHNLFRPAQTVVREIYHGREVSCVTYIATDTVRKQLLPLTIHQNGEDALFIQRLLAIARKQKLPEGYLSAYLSHLLLTTTSSKRERFSTETPLEQNTDPLPALLSTLATPMSEDKELKSLARPSPWLIVFALYLVLLLLSILSLAALQGMGMLGAKLNNNFYLLGVPWLMLAYGLIGGCISSLSRLGRLNAVKPPVFVIITWFTRPFIGALLALFVYLLLTSGMFVLGKSVGSHQAIFLLAAALSGLCEGWVFVRKSHQ
jgi:cation transport regulator ChaC